MNQKIIESYLALLIARIIKSTININHILNHSALHNTYLYCIFLYEIKKYMVNKSIIINYIENRFRVVYWNHPYEMEYELVFYLDDKERKEYYINKSRYWNYSKRIENFIISYFSQNLTVVVYSNKF